MDDPNLVFSAGRVPVMCLAEAAALRTLADKRLMVAADKGVDTGQKLASSAGGLKPSP